jgi:DNA-binding NtrC family response regulator
VSAITTKTFPPESITVEGGAPSDPDLAQTLAVERVTTLLRSPGHIMFEGEPGVGKRFHALLLHSAWSASGQGEFAEVDPDMPEDMLRALLFDDNRKLIEGRERIRLPSLGGRSTLFLRRLQEFSNINQRLIARFLIEQQLAIPERRTVKVVASVESFPFNPGRVNPFDSLTESLGEFQRCTIPPLRERLEELPSLVHALLMDFRRKEAVDCWRVSSDVMEKLIKRRWRDNVRELRYVLEWGALNASDGTLRLRSAFLDEVEMILDVSALIHAGKRISVDRSLSTMERLIVERALLRYGFDIRKVARALDLTEPNLFYKIRKHNIHIPAGDSQTL